MVTPASSSDEVERLQSVYRGYDADATARHRWSDRNRGNQAILRERAARARAALVDAARWPADGRPCLEVGCGAGGALADLFVESAVDQRATPPAVGLDLSEERLHTAVERLPGVPFVCGEGSTLPFPSQRFDLVLAFTVFSSIRDDGLARQIAVEMGRVLRPGGAVLWYDMRRPNPFNPHTRAMPQREVRALFPDFTASLEPITLLPPLARRLGPITALAYPLLRRVPPLNTHYLGVIAKPR